MDEFVRGGAWQASAKIATRSPQIVSLGYTFFDVRWRR